MSSFNRRPSTHSVRSKCVDPRAPPMNFPQRPLHSDRHSGLSQVRTCRVISVSCSGLGSFRQWPSRTRVFVPCIAKTPLTGDALSTVLSSPRAPRRLTACASVDAARRLATSSGAVLPMVPAADDGLVLCDDVVVVSRGDVSSPRAPRRLIACASAAARRRPEASSGGAVPSEVAAADDGPALCDGGVVVSREDVGSALSSPRAPRRLMACVSAAARRRLERSSGVRGTAPPEVPAADDGPALCDGRVVVSLGDAGGVISPVRSFTSRMMRCRATFSCHWKGALRHIGHRFSGKDFTWDLQRIWLQARQLIHSRHISIHTGHSKNFGSMLQYEFLEGQSS